MSPDENSACENCGRFGAVAIGDRALCPECVTTSGDCCAGVENETDE